MGNRTKAAVKSDMFKAGLSTDKVEALSERAELKGTKAKEFVKKSKQTIGKITHAQQVKLFDNTYPDYERRANTELW